MRARHLAHGSYSISRPIFGIGERCLYYRIGAGSWAQGLRYRRCQYAGCFTAVAGLMCTGQINRFRVRCPGVRGIHDAYRRNVHSRPAIACIADTSLTTVDVPV
jgi:hypothetical protein